MAEKNTPNGVFEKKEQTKKQTTNKGVVGGFLFGTKICSGGGGITGQWYNGLSPSGNWGDRYSWHKQEIWKGRKSLLGFIGTTEWSGWGFKCNALDIKVWSANGANAVVDPSVFATNTVFNPYPESIMNPHASRLETDFHLAQGIPARSPPTGRTDLTGSGITSFNMSTTRFMANT